MFSSPAVSGNIVLEVTDCKETTIQIQPDSTEMKMILGSGEITALWEQIEKAVFTCATRTFSSGKDTHKFLSENPVEIYYKNGKTKKFVFDYFLHKGAAFEFAGKTDFGSEYKIKVTDIRLITVK